MTSIMRAFALEVFGILQAGLLFHYIDSRRIAGLTAGCIFVVIEIGVIVLSLRSERRLKSLGFWVAILMLIVFSLPMLVARATHFDLAWSEIKVWGFRGPELHRYSMYFYTALMSSTIIDALFIRWKKVWPK